MESVRFDLVQAPRLAAEMEQAGLEIGAARTRIAHLLAREGDADPGLGRLLDQAVTWGIATSADLRWRLDYLASCEAFLPNVSFRSGADGTVRAELPFRDAAEADRWARGARLHASLVGALAAVDAGGAEQALLDLDAALADPFVLAGFAGALGATGLADLRDRIDVARRRDPLDSLTELWHRGRNPVWDHLDTMVGEFAGRTGGLAAYGSADPVELRFRGGGLQVVSMQDLLLASPETLPGLWADDLDLTQQPLLLLGGLVVATTPRGPAVTGSGLLVPRIEGVPGTSLWWDDRLGRFATSTVATPSPLALVGATAHQVLRHPIRSVGVAVEHPGQAVAGFLGGASLVVTGGFLVAAGSSILAFAGAGSAAGAGASFAAASTAGTAFGLASVARQAFDGAPCRAERVAAGGGTFLLGGAIAGALSAGGLRAASSLVGAAGVHDFGLSGFVDCP